MAPSLVIATAFALFGILSLLAWAGRRDRTELLWFSLVCCVASYTSFGDWAFLSPNALPFNRHGGMLQAAFLMVQHALQGFFTASALHNRSRWPRLALVLLTGGFLSVVALARVPGIGLANGYSFGWALASAVSLGIILASWLQVRKRATGIQRVFHLVLAIGPARLILLLVQRLFGQVAVDYASIGDFFVSKNAVALLLLAALIFWLMVRQLAAERRDAQRLGGELEAARAVQQLLLSTTGAHHAGFRIESSYHPAQEVGGDFYQVFPLNDGGNLLVVGDVSGKGLKAAMVVSLITGALRNRRSDSPDEVLSELNRVLAGGMDGGFVTAAAARCFPDGRVIISNAGNPPPSLAEEEVQLEAGLPLGLIPEMEYKQQELMVPHGQQLTFVSDGVIEAANAKGDLFGFEEARKISGMPAQEIAEAAKAWGQNDDITVVTVRRAA